jgi:uncharacterized UBP type Zn finger protein
VTQLTQPCQHVVGLQPPSQPGDVCEECAAVGGTWVSLRQCMACGHVGCCDSSPNRHARGHFEGTGHPVIRSAMPGDDWWFCFPDEMTVRQEPDGRIVPIDLWWEAGINSVRRLLAEQPTAELAAGARAANGFPVGDWAEQQRQARAAGRPAARAGRGPAGCARLALVNSDTPATGLASPDRPPLASH